MQRDPDSREEQIIAEVLGPSVGDLLEIGCGDGRLTGKLAEVCQTLTALDTELLWVMEAGDSFVRGARFLSASGEDLPLTDNCVDAVVFSLSLHHQNPFKALKEARRVLRENGRILVLEPVQHSLMTMLFAFLHDESYEYEQAEAAIDSSGLRIMLSGSVRTRWIFEDFAEMNDYLFNYFNLAPDAEKGNLMARLLGARRTLKPLCIEDITRFWLLREEPDPSQAGVQ